MIVIELGLEKSTKMADFEVQLTCNVLATKHLESMISEANRPFGFLKSTLS